MLSNKNKKLLSLIVTIGLLLFVYNYRPTLYFFSTINLPNFPISLSAHCYDNSCVQTQLYNPNIPTLYGDYIITTEASMYARADGGRSNGNGGFSSSGYNIGSCGDGISATACVNPASYSGYCNGRYTYNDRISKSSKMQVITDTSTNTQKCYIDGVLISTNPLTASGIDIVYNARSSRYGNYDSSSSSLTSPYLTIEDTSSKRFVEYNIYDTFDEPTLNPSRWGPPSGTIDSRFGKVFLNPGTIPMLENMKGRIVYLEYETTGTGSVSLTDNLGNTYTLNLGGQESGVIKLETSPLDTNKMYWFFRGKQVKDVDYSAVDEVTFSISGTNVFIDNVGFRVLYQTCELGKNQFLAYETFTGPQVISHYSARKTIQQYCINLPPTLKKGTGFEQVPELINILANGKTYNVASGDTVILPYIYTKTDTETLPCIPGTGQIFNVANNTCEDIRGITFFCSEGTWNPASHSCDIYPQTKFICSSGVLDITDPTNPICVVHPPEQAICLNPNATYDSSSGQCMWYPPSAIDCSPQETYDSIRKVCVSTPIKLINCPYNTAYDSTIDKCIGTREVILTNNTVVIQNVTYNTISPDVSCNQYGGSWDAGKKVCTIIAPKVYKCPSDSMEKLINGRNVCVSTLPTVSSPSPSIPLISPTKKTFPTFILIILGIIFVYLFFEIGPHRGFIRK